MNHKSTFLLILPSSSPCLLINTNSFTYCKMVLTNSECTKKKLKEERKRTQLISDLLFRFYTFFCYWNASVRWLKKLKYLYQICSHRNISGKKYIHLLLLFISFSLNLWTIYFSHTLSFSSFFFIIYFLISIYIYFFIQIFICESVSLLQGIGYSLNDWQRCVFNILARIESKAWWAWVTGSHYNRVGQSPAIHRTISIFPPPFSLSLSLSLTCSYSVSSYSSTI